MLFLQHGESVIDNARHRHDHLEEFAANSLLAERKPPKTVVALIAQAFPQATGLEVIFLLVSLAEEIQKWQPRDEFDLALPASIFKACAILGADLFALEVQKITPASCGALIEYWGKDEKFFR